MFKKVILAIIILGVLAFGAKWYLDSSNAESSELTEIPSVTVTEGSIVSKALATGTIEPRHEIQVKSKISGVVQELYAEPGTYVRKGDPLLEIRPDPTPLELAEAKRNMELTEIVLVNLETEWNRAKSLKERNLISDHDFEAIQQRLNDAKVRHQLNKERLELLESGRVKIGDSLIESVIRAPISGYVLERMVEIGDPIVPLTSFPVLCIA